MRSRTTRRLFDAGSSRCATTLALVMAVAGCGGKHAYPTRDGSADVKRDRGLININGEFNACPEVALVASPTRTRVGTSIEVSAHATDADNDPMIYIWEADAGSFANPMAASTTFMCTTAGVRTITLTVSDGSCEPVTSATVICVVSDGGAGDGAPSDGGAVDRGAADGGATDRVTTFDASDSGAAPDIAASGDVGGASDSGGAGATDSGGAGGGGGTPGGGGDPTKDEGPMCNDCTSTQCNATTDGCDLFTDATQRKRCTDLYACIRQNACSELGDPTPCWCGTTPYATCITVPGSANGPCVAQVQESADSQDPNIIKQRFVNPMFPVGGAVNLSVCRGSFCVDECR